MAGAEIFRFGAFRMDCEQRLLMHCGQRVALRGKAFDLLELLARRGGKIVDKTALLRALWPGIAVHENNIAVTVRSLRTALRAHDPALELIETVPGRGYRLASGVLRAPSAAPAPSAAGAGSALTQGARREPGLPRVEPFVAREAELGRLDALWAAARHGAGQVVFVSGEPGIGKSTLVQQFVTRAVAQAPLSLVLSGQCIQLFGLAEPHLPFREALAAGLSSLGRAELLEALELHAPGWCARLPPALVGARTPHAEPWHAAHAGAHELAEALRAAAASRPLLLVLEDLHWADASSVDVLRWLCARVDARPLLVVGTYRPAEVRAQRHPLGALLDELAARRQRQELALPPWRAHELEHYLVARFGASTLAARLAAVIERRSEGLPLLCVRLIEALLSRELVRHDATDGWVCSLPVEALELDAPDSVSALIASQLELLPRRLRRLLELASVDGAEFGTALASRALGRAAAEVEGELEQLAAHGLIERLGDAADDDVASERSSPAGQLARPPMSPLDVRYRFRHVLYRDHLYEQLGSHRRLELHLAIADALLASSPALPVSPSRLAFHFERGRDFSRAVACWTEAGDAADRAFAQHEALECYQRAAALLEALPPGERALRRLVLEHGRGWASYVLARSSAARGHFLEFVRQARELLVAPESERAPALALASEYFERPWCDAVMRRPAGIFPRAASGDVGSELLAEALHCCCHIDNAEGRSAELHEHARALERVAEASQSRPRRAEALAWLGAHALLDGRADQARRWLDEALALARGLDHERALRVALWHRAWLHRAQAELEPAQAAYEELVSRVPDTSTAAAMLSELGATLAARGRPGAALDAYERADRLRQRMEPGYPSLHGWLWRELGQPARARELDASALERLRGKAEPLTLVRLLSSLASTCCRRGDPVAAHEPLDEAEALVPADHRDCSWRMGPLWSARCELAALTGDLPALQQLAARWLRSARTRADAEGVKHACRWLALGLAHTGDAMRALRQLRLGLEATKARPVPLVDWRCQALLAELAARAGDVSLASRARADAKGTIDAIASGIDGQDERLGFERMALRELGAGPAPAERCRQRVH